MRAVVTRVLNASVAIGGKTTAEIPRGFLVLLGVRKGDTAPVAEKMADRIAGLRVFSDADGKMNVSPENASAEMLVVSQFTLYADVRSRRPGFTEAARPEEAIPLYETVISELKRRGFSVKTGVFGADMQVSSVNDGPVTILIDSDQW